MTDDPIAQFHHWFAQAQKARIRKPEAMALATADAKSRPSVRFVLLKHVDERGFTFFTNARSRKGRELKENPRASVAIHWDPIGKQVRVEGSIEVLSAAEVDAYWATRPRDSQLGAVVSDQSAELKSRAWLLAEWKVLRQKYRGQEIPRPAHWKGYRIIPDAIEFWTHHEHRLHERELFTRTKRGWNRKLLQP